MVQKFSCQLWVLRASSARSRIWAVVVSGTPNSRAVTLPERRRASVHRYYCEAQQTTSQAQCQSQCQRQSQCQSQRVSVRPCLGISRTYYSAIVACRRQTASLPCPTSAREGPRPPSDCGCILGLDLINQEDLQQASGRESSLPCGRACVNGQGGHGRR